MKQSDRVKKRPAIGIKWKLFAYLAGFAAVILLVLWLCQVVFLSDIYRFIKTTEIRAAAHELSRAVNDADTLSARSEEIARRNEVCILVLQMLNDDEAVQLVSCDVLKDCAIHNMTRSGVFTLYDSAVGNGGRNLQHFRFDSLTKRYVGIKAGNNGGDPESIIYSLVVTDNEGNDVLLILNSVVSPVDATVKTLNLLLIAVSILMVCLALLLAVLISGKISRPIVRLSSDAKSLAEGRYDTVFRGGSYREIDELSDALNYAEHELSKVDNLRRELIANTSHDLRTPLTMITGYAEVMRDLPGENTPENAQIIIDESRRLTSLVNDMLDISKLESGSQTLTPERFSLTGTLRDALNRYGQFTTRDGYRIDFFAEEDVTVTTDRSKFLQAFCNLVNNALTYTGPDKTVTVTQSVGAAEDGRRVRVSVTDTGEGIPPDKLALIWDRYYKIDSSHRRAAQGSGLGLSIVNRIMTLLDGRCGVESEVGRGSTFWLEIRCE